MLLVEQAPGITLLPNSNVKVSHGPQRDPHTEDVLVLCPRT